MNSKFSTFLLPINVRWCIPLKCGLFLMILHVRCQRSGCVISTIAYSTLKWFLIVMRFHMNFQMIAKFYKRKKKCQIKNCSFQKQFAALSVGQWKRRNKKNRSFKILLSVIKRFDRVCHQIKQKINSRE